MFGDVILVNGRPWPAMPVERRKYRFRLLNASISRSYRLALSTGDPFTVIGTDGGLMPAPAETTSLRFGMAERYEIVVDFAKYPIGTRVVLQNLGLPNNIDFATTGEVMAFDVTGDATDLSNNEVPPVLNPDNEVMRLTEGEAVKTRTMEFTRQGGEWTVNGQTWEDVINSGFTQVVASPKLGDVEIWELKNDSGGWFHPVHIHLVDFQILDRNGQPPHPYERGPKDVAYVGEGETVRVLMRFGPQIGRYMMHCHNLVHEDHDMMVQFEVGTGGDDPIEHDRPKHQPAPELHGDEPGSGSAAVRLGRRVRPAAPARDPGSGPARGRAAAAGRQGRQRQAEAQAEAEGQGQGQEEGPPQAEAEAKRKRKAKRKPSARKPGTRR